MRMRTSPFCLVFSHDRTRAARGTVANIHQFLSSFEAMQAPEKWSYVLDFHGGKRHRCFCSDAASGPIDEVQRPTVHFREEVHPLKTNRRRVLLRRHR